MSTPAAPPAPGPLRGAARMPGHPNATLITIVLCQFMVGLDGTVTNIALPKIHAALHFSPTGLAWVTNAYVLSFGGLLLLGGRAGDILGRRRLFIGGLALFAAASLFGGLATSAAWLLAARVAQGVGAAAAAPNALALITSNFEEGPKRNRALAAVAGAYAGSLTLGLIAGGMLTGWASWRWVMFINVPIAALVALLAPLFVNEAERHPGRFDLPGALLSVGAMVGLVYGFLHAASAGWDNAATIGTLAAAAVLVVAFVAVELRAEQPVLPLGVLRSRGRTASYVSMLILAGPLFAVNFFVTQVLQNVRGFSPVTAGVAFLPMAVGLMASAGIAAQLLPRIGHRPVILGGMALIVAGLIWLGRMDASTSFAAGLLGPTILLGAGPGAAFTAFNELILSGVDSRNTGAASSVLEAMQWVGGGLGLSILVTVFGTASRDAAAHLPASVGPQGAGSYVLVHGIATAFTWSLVLVGIALLATLFGIRGGKQVVPAGEKGEQPGAHAQSAADEIPAVR